VKRGVRDGIALLLIAAVAAAATLLRSARVPLPAVENCAQVDRAPAIRPDYADVVIPPNIAPLNFCVEEPGTRYLVRVGLPGAEKFDVMARTRSIIIPEADWKKLLAAARGRQIEFEVYAGDKTGAWRRFRPFRVAVSRDEADPYIVYRYMNVIYRWYTKMRLVQRNIETFASRVVLDNRSFGGCMNCHTFLNNDTGRMLVQVRSNPVRDYGSGMLLFQDGTVTKVDTRTRFRPGMAAYASWHPSGRAIAYSINVPRLFMHTARAEVRESLDLDSDLALYLPDSGRVTTTQALADPHRLETWPAWSADGKYLYYCSAPRWWADEEGEDVPVFKKARVLYDLMRIPYDIDTGKWGEPETVLSAAQIGRSISQPRPSPDGRFVAFCMSDYGGYGDMQVESDLYLLDLRTGAYRRMECNSDRSESWHSWSSNGRWLVFASKRDDGLFMRVYFAHVAEDGASSKAFVLPQKDPTRYDSDIHLYQMPEFVRHPVPITGEALGSVIRSGEWKRVDVLATRATPAATR